MQLVAVLRPIFEFPAWVPRLIFLFIAIGFGVALVAAWVYELTPEGVQLDKDVDRSRSISRQTGRKLDFLIIGFLSVAVIYFVIDKFALDDGPQTVIFESTEAGQSIAVLPFVNMSSDPEQEFFSDGLTEEILTLLTKIPNLKVIGRTSSFAFKGKYEDLRVIGEALGVNTVLEGSVRKSGEQLRITAQLINVSDGSNIWSQSYDRTLTEIFEVQDEVAASIIDALQIHVTKNPVRGQPTGNSEAYALFLKARNATSVYDWRTSEELLFEATRMDPKFAEAYELLASIYWRRAGTSYLAKEAQRLSGEAAAKAVAINPDLALAQALYVMGDVEHYSLLAEIEALELANQQEPNNLMILDTLFYDLLKTGYLEEALTISRRMVDIDPLSPSANGRLPGALFALGFTREGFAAVDIFANVDPDREYWYVAEINLTHNRDRAAIAHFEAVLAQDGYPDSSWVEDLVAGARDPDTGQSYLERRIPEIAASLPEEFADDIQRNLGFWYLYLGHVDRYFEIILDLDLTNNTWTEADDYVVAGVAKPEIGFRAHPKFLEVADALGITDVWEQRGSPDFCQKVDGQWVCE